MAVVQICGCYDGPNEGEVISFVSNQEAAYYGVYLGFPGSFRHQEDKPNREEALAAAEALVASGKASEISDATFDKQTITP